MMIRFLVGMAMLAAVHAGCAAQAAGDAAPPGTIINETVSPLAHGFRLVRRSVVAPPHSTPAVSDQHHVFAGTIELCTCNPDTVFISSDGRFAIYPHYGERALKLFRTADQHKSTLGTLWGKPISALWDPAANRVTVRFRVNYHARDKEHDKVYEFDMAPGG